MRHHHLSDRDLVLALDGELPVRRQAVVEAHLTECPSCQTRRTQLHEGVELATAIYRSASVDTESIATSREALRSKLAMLGREQVPFVDRVFPSFAGISRWAVVGAAAVAVALAGTALASHSWGSYHWSRTANPLKLNVGDNVDSRWDSYLNEAVSDWSASSVLDLTKVAGGTSPTTCAPTAGRVEACNGSYGATGWLGIAQIWAGEPTPCARK